MQKSNKIIKLTLAGGEVIGLFSKFNSTNVDIWRISRGRLEMRLFDTSNETNVKHVNSRRKKEQIIIYSKLLL